MMMSRGGRGKIRAPRRVFTREEVDSEETWEVLHKAFREIHARNASNLSFEELFRNAYRLVLKKKGDFLFEKVKELEIDILDNQVRTQIRSLAVPSLLSTGTEVSLLEKRQAGERFMHQLTRSFQAHSQEAGMITDVLMYMNRISQSDGRRPSIYAVALGLFRERVLQANANPELQMRILEVLEMTILDMIALERSGEIIDRPLVKASCRMLESLYETLAEEESTRLYSTSFEPKFLEASRAYYQNEGRLLVQEADATTFCSQARKRLREEEERCQQTLSLSTEDKIRLVVEKELIEAHIGDVIDLPGTGVKYMLDNDKVADLHNLYELVRRVDTKLKPLKTAVHKRVLELGAEVNNAAQQIANEAPQKQRPERKDADVGKPREKGPPPKQLNQQTLAAVNWVEEVLKLKAKYDAVCDRAFRSDPVMEKSLEISFQDFINNNPRSPEFLSLFLDQYLKSSGKDKSEAEIDALLDNGVTLVQYLADKDVLETYYHKHMAKRLLTGKSVSRDVERQMLSKMKMRLGNQFTSKMEGLLKDIELSEGHTTGYKEYLAASGDKSKIDFDISVLTTTVWPIPLPDASERACRLPTEAARVKDSFEQFYFSKHTGRKLTWLPHMGDVTMRATYEKAGKPITYEVSGSVYCMCILMLFNEHQRLTCDEIVQSTNIPQDKVQQTLLSIAVAPKTRLLKKEPMSRDINPSDVFSYNEKFEFAYRKFKVAMVTDQTNKVETTEQRKETQKKADDERGLAIDAAVVRIMKARKTLSHQQLMTETIDISKSRFSPDVAMIKRKIESLIEREYLERGGDAANPSYNYLA